MARMENETLIPIAGFFVHTLNSKVYEFHIVSPGFSCPEAGTLLFLGRFGAKPRTISRYQHYSIEYDEKGI